MCLWNENILQAKLGYPHLDNSLIRFLFSASNMVVVSVGSEQTEELLSN